MQGDTISAIATSAGNAGIGIIRISGEHAIAVADRIFCGVRGKKLSETESYRALYGRIVEDGETIDEAIALIMRAPHSYTMEDVVELQCHGGRLPLKKTLELTYRNGARPAERGEFTKRAFLNGRLDLTEAQAVMQVIGAKTEASLKQAAGLLSGRLKGEISSIRHKILGEIAHLEAVIDFPEDEVEDVVSMEVRKAVCEAADDVEKLLKSAHTGRILSEGLVTAIIGKPNVGKSSLLNALLREERAIVTDIPGTTRDSIEEFAEIGGVPLRIIDTAGIRETSDVVEKIGVDKSKEYVDSAQLILALFDGSKELSAEDEEIMELLSGREAILLVTKDDLDMVFPLSRLKERFPSMPLCQISTREERGLQSLEEEIVKKVYGENMELNAEALVSHEREVNLLREAKEHLLAAIRTIDAAMGEDFVSIDLRSAWEKLGEITGETAGEDMINEIFTRFCIGK